MKPGRANVGHVVLGLALMGLALWVVPSTAQPGSQGSSSDIRIVELQGEVELMPAGAATWVLTQTNQVLHPADRLRTGLNSRAALLWSDQSVVPLGQLTEIEILPPDNPDSLSGLHVVKGVVSFFHRDKPGRIRVLFQGANANVEGTEFVLEVADANGGGHSTLSLIDGKVRLSNAQGTLLLTNQEQAVVEPGQAPLRTAGFNTDNLLQWCFYYPAVLDLRDLSLTADEEQALKDSLEAYRAGDLLSALARYPVSRQPASDDERLYHAALLLSVGQVEQTEAELAGLPEGKQVDRVQRLKNSLDTLIAAVKRRPKPSSLDPQLATELMAASYYEQSRALGEESLGAALDLARRAAALSPQFGFAWGRVAELEFSFGRTDEALTALETSLQQSPRNAQGLALKGFVLAAQNKTVEATTWFDRSIAVDAALANAWLGRGLCRIRRGDAADGRADLLVAAALEPQRAELRSYLGKAYADAFDDARAARELQLALRLDPNDPTGWLYSALLKQQQNRINEAAADLEASQARNDNRRLFRSRLLLDEDLAVQSANLASIYRDDGMTDVSVREAARSVTEDYANASAHLFLSDSYYNLLDPTQFNLRYDTVWFNELLLANVLSPVGGGRLSQTVSQQDYSKLFATDGLGLASSSDVRTDGMFHQQASQYGTFDNTSYALDLDYHHNDGVRVNNALDSINWNTTIKQQVTPHDTAMLLVQYEDYHSGDNFQYYYQTNARPFYQFNEQQQPNIVGTWRHEWSPGMNTILLAGRLVDDQQFSDQAGDERGGFYQFQETPGGIIVNQVPLNVTYDEQFEIYTAELNQICQWDRVTLSAGARYQSGTFQTQDQLSSPTGAPIFPLPPLPVTGSVSSSFERETAYSYLTVEPLENLWLTGGVVADREEFPNNFRQPPISGGEATKSQLGPKAALVWSPLPAVTVRGIYALSLGGLSVDESYRLEPTELAGFPQAFRSLISESVVGSQSAPTFEILGTALDLKLGTRTYAGLQVKRLRSDVNQGVGVFLTPFGGLTSTVSSTEEQLHYTEYNFGASLNQLVGNEVVLGAAYRFTQSDLGYVFPDVPSLGQTQKAILQEADSYALFNHRSGFFARAEVHWYGQANAPLAASAPEPQVSFFQENLFAGWNFAHRRAQLQLGILNLSGGDYHLDPLTVYQELPRKRVFEAKLNFIF
ncbi:MAG TPA: FecR domain-containing protein [Verrucomicrobiae bacterium]|jgi:Tfp pilus assembly protein PilF|nr:FecR domain-containing protein [Verrucomicrobiae bacterium]